MVTETIEVRPRDDLRGGQWIQHWDPNDPKFWKTSGRQVARRNLVYSIFAEFLAFSVWQVFSTAEDGFTSQIWLHSAGFVWVPLILLASWFAYRYMNNLLVQKNSVRSQSVIVKRKHTWLMSVLYTGTFGSFIGYAASFPLLIRTQFPDDAGLVAYAFIGPAVGSLIRPVGGWLSDKVGGVRVTLWNFMVMIVAVLGVLFFLGIKEAAATLGFTSAIAA